LTEQYRNNPIPKVWSVFSIYSRQILFVVGYFSKKFLICVTKMFQQIYESLVNAYNEFKYGVITSPSYKNDIAKSFYKDPVAHVPTSYHRLFKMFRYLSMNSNDVFFDLGSGLGRVICVASTFNAGKIVGVELIEESAIIARKNLLAMDNKNANVSVIVDDVINIDMNSGTIFFLYKPFGWKTLNHVLNNLHDSLDENPRFVRILYYCKQEFGVLLDMCDWLEAKGEIGKTDIYEWQHNPCIEKI
jgi:hypothetical protein